MKYFVKSQCLALAIISSHLFGYPLYTITSNISQMTDEELGAAKELTSDVVLPIVLPKTLFGPPSHRSSLRCICLT